MNLPQSSSTTSSPNPSSASAGGSRGSSSVSDTVEKVRQATASTAAKAKDKAAEIATEGKTAAADKVSGYSAQLREAARNADAKKDPNIAHFAGQAANRLEQVADYVRDADFNRMRDDAARVARRHPALFMGGMLVAGLILGNLAKASVQTLRESSSDRDSEGEGSDEFDDSSDLSSREQNESVTSTPAEGDDDVAVGANLQENNAQR